MAAQLQPEDARIWERSRRGLAEHARFQEAARYCAQATELEPQGKTIFTAWATRVYPLDRLEEAAAAFQRAVELAPQDAESWNNLGKCLKE